MHFLRSHYATVHWTRKKKKKPFYKIFMDVTDERGLNIPETVRVTGLTDRQVRTIITREMKVAPLDLALQLSETLNVPLAVWLDEEEYTPPEVSAEAYEVAHAYALLLLPPAAQGNAAARFVTAAEGIFPTTIICFFPESTLTLPRPHPIIKPYKKSPASAGAFSKQRGANQMFCPNCGANLPRDSRYCSECGEAVVNPVPKRPKLQQLLEQLPPLYKKLLMAFVAVFAVGVICSVLSVMIKPTVNLNRYLVPEFTGYNEYGHANVHIDIEKFVKDHGQRLTDYVGTGDEYEAAEYFLNDVVNGHPSKDRRLTNGDTLKYLWDCDDKGAMERYHCKLKYKTREFTVKDLPDPTEFDPFAGLELTYEGIAPYGRAYISGEATHPAVEALYYDLEDAYDLSDGDTVTMYFSIRGYYMEEEELVEYLAGEFGLVPTATTKEFTVDGINRYMTDISELSANVLSDMNTRAEEIFLNNYLNSEGTFLGMTYCGSYLISDPDDIDGWFSNELFAVYQVQVHHEYSRRGNEYSADTTFYWCLNFDDVLTNSKGVTTLELEYYDVPYHYFEIDSGVSSGWYNKTWEYRGFATTDDIYQYLVDNYGTGYTYTNNVSVPTN